MVKQTRERERTGLEVRLAERQEANRAARQTKVTAEDVQRRVAERRAAKSARRVPTPAGRTARGVALVTGFAFLLGAGCIALSIANGNTAYEVTSANNVQEIGKAKADLAAIPAADEHAASTYAEKLQARLDTATAKGREVAALQQEFQSILVRGNEQRSDNGAATPALTAAAAHRKQLAPYFVDRAMIAPDTEAYAPGSVLPFDADQIDPRFEWHVAYDANGTTVADPKASTWTLTSMVATDTSGVFEATWVDKRTSDGELLAWATASYYVSEGKFGSLRLGLTTLGSNGALNDQTAGN